MSIDALRRAIVSLVNADSQVRAVTGRTSMNIVARGSLSEVADPIMTFFLVASPEPGGTDQRRRVVMQIDCWGDPKNGSTLTDLSTLMDRAEALFTATNLAGESPSVDAAVYKGSIRDSFPQPDGVLSISQDFTFELAI